MNPPQGKIALPTYSGDPTQWAIDLYAAGRCFNPDHDELPHSEFTSDEAGYIADTIGAFSESQYNEFQDAMVTEMHRENKTLESHNPPPEEAPAPVIAFDENEHCAQQDDIIDSIATLARCDRGRKVLRLLHTMIQDGNMCGLDSTNRACLSHLFTAVLHGGFPGYVADNITIALEEIHA